MLHKNKKTTWVKTPKEKKGKAKKPRMFFAKLIEQYRAWGKMFKYQEEKLKKYLIEKLDTMCSQIVRSRDCAGERVKCNSEWSCSSCTTWITYWTSCCAHWIDRWWWSHRWDFRNLFSTCYGCNDPSYDAIIHKTELQFKIELLYWREVVREMRTSKNKVKPNLNELVQLYDKILPVWEQIPVEWKW